MSNNVPLKEYTAKVKNYANITNDGIKGAVIQKKDPLEVHHRMWQCALDLALKNKGAKLRHLAHRITKSHQKKK